jgi:SPP1 gp7 family putative phage head morphogenesis protein
MKPELEELAENISASMIACLPNEKAVAAIGAKAVVLPDTFGKLLPEIKARAFTVAGIIHADALQAIRDRIADLPAGEDFRSIQGDVASQLLPYFIDPNADDKIRDKQEGAALRKAEMLVKQNGFQAYAAGMYDVMDRQRDAFPYWQYITVGDDRVRDEHAALDGLTLPADSPFWQTHYPPWEWGCRCQVVPIDPETYDLIQSGEEPGRALSEQETKDLEQNGRILDKQAGRVVSVLPSQDPGAFRWNPGDLRIPISDLREQYDPLTFSIFEAEMKSTALDGGKTVWDWLND